MRINPYLKCWDNESYSTLPVATTYSRYCILCLVLILLVSLGLALLFATPCWSKTSSKSDLHSYTNLYFEKLADAIYRAEGGSASGYPYGVRYKGCDWQHEGFCRKVCLNTLKNAYKRFLAAESNKGTSSVLGHLNAKERHSSFIAYLSKTYAPIGAENDPFNLNVNWISNVNYFMNKEAL